MYRKLILLLTCVVLALAFVLTLSSCSEEPTAPEEFTNVEPGINSDIHKDEGNVGIVIDTRQIVKTGYLPTTATVSFPNYSRFDTTLSIDASTNIAIMNIHNTELSEEERAAFNNGIVVNIVIRDATQILTTYDDTNLELNDSNLPLNFATELPNAPLPPLAIKEDIPYLLQHDGSDSVITSTCGFGCYQDNSFGINDWQQQFYFTLVEGGGSDSYHISHPGYEEGIFWYFDDGLQWISLRGGTVPGGPDVFTLEQDEEGWVRIRHEGTGLYVDHFNGPGINPLKLLLNITGDRFRIIADLKWQIEDRGTVYHQPIMPPVLLDFAYSGTLRNCSSAILEESVGRTESRTWTTTIGTSESLQLFSSETFSLGVKIGFEVKAKVGVKVPGVGEAGEEVTVSEEVNINQSFTTSETTSNENTWSESTSKTIEVSRIRTLTVPPFTAVEVYDAVKTVENIILPFTQELRIRATDWENNAPLSGDEIVTQMLFNFATGVVSNVGSDFIDITIRGNATMTSLFEGTTDVNELVNGCN